MNRYLSPSFCLILFMTILSQTIAQKTIGSTTLNAPKKRIALLIGNNNYTARNLPQLTNPERDVDALQEVLEDLGFKVLPYKNLDLSKIKLRYQEFLDLLEREKPEVAWVYFSGHGLGVNGVNYLLPVDTRINCVEQLQAYEAASLNQWIASLLQKKIKHNFIFLDACRNLGNLKDCNDSPITGKVQGLAKPLEKYRNLLIAFATTEGETADDNTFDKNNSLFTAELLKNLPLPDSSINQILKRTRRSVYTRSDSTQFPVWWDGAIEDYVFTRTLHAPPPTNVISVVAYKPNGKDLDTYVAKLAVEQLKAQLPNYDIRLQTNSKGPSVSGILCTVTRQTNIGTQQVLGNSLILAETQLKLTFRQDKELLDEIELSEGGTDNQEKIAVDNSIKRAFVHLKEQHINIQSANHQNNTTKR